MSSNIDNDFDVLLGLSLDLLLPWLTEDKD